MVKTGELRAEMVQRQLVARGIEDRLVLDAMAQVPREGFVPDDLERFAYDDAPLPIGEEQTISQPYIVALMVQALELSPTDRVLEIGTGSGYAAAVLGEIAREVYTVERHGTLARTADERLERLGYDNVHVRHGDGAEGWADQAPYDGVLVSAGSPEVPEPLREQLAVGGRLVIPVGRAPQVQRLIRLRKTEGGEFERQDLGGVRFVPLVRESR